MAKVYVCDVCRGIIDNPYYANMKTVKVWSYKYCFGGPCKHQEKLNLCRYCYDNMIKYLKKIKEETK